MNLPTTGISCQIYRWSLGDCSAHGLSSRCQAVTLLDPRLPAGPVEPSDDQPAVRLVRRHLFGADHWHAEPVDPPPAGACRMHGGTFIKGDSRFGALVGHHFPVALHDRHEFSH